MTTTVFQPSLYDNYILASSVNANYGSATTINIGRYINNSTNLGRGLIYFDITSASVVSLSSAILSLYLTNNSFNTAGTTLSVYKFKRKWTEKDSTWNMYNSSQSWQTAGGFGINDCEQTSIGSIVIPPTTGSGTWLDISLDIDEIQKYIANYLHCGFLLKTDEGNYTRFSVASNNNATTTIRPKLTLEYAELSSKPIFVSSSITQRGTQNAFPSPYSETVNVPVMNNGLMLVGIGTDPLVISASGLTLSGSPFAYIDAESSSRNSIAVFYFKNPPSGSQILELIPSTTSMAGIIQKYMISNVDQDNPIGTITKSNGTLTKELTIINNVGSDGGNLIIDFIVGNHYNTTAKVGYYFLGSNFPTMYQTAITGGFHDTVSSTYNVRQDSSYRISGSATQPMAWTGTYTSVPYKYIAVPIKGVGDASYGTYDQYTKALLHFDGSEGSYTFRDEIQNIWTPYRYPSTSGSGPYISTAQQKFGTGSGYFAGSAVGDWIETPTQFNFGSQDWTCDFWIRPNFDGIETSWTHRGLFGYDVDDYNFWSCEISGSATDNQRFRYIEKLSGSSVYAAIGSIMPLQEDVWQHVAFVKQGTNLKGYLSGTNYMNTTIGSSMRSFMNQIFKIGNVGTASMYRGYMDEFRLSIGIKRWTSNFTPPTAPYAPVTAPRGQPFMYSSYPWI